MKRRPAGLTLVEVLVSLAVLGVLSLALLRIYDVSRTAYATGTGRLTLQQAARQLVSRIGPQLVAAVPPSEVEEAIYAPEAGSSASSIVFSVPQEPFDPRNPGFRKLRIGQRPDGAVVLDPNTILVESDDQVLARPLVDSRGNQVFKVDKLEFSVLSRNVVKISLDVSGQARGAQNKMMTQTLHLESLVQLPVYTTR